MENKVKVKIEHIVDFPVAGEKHLIFSLNKKIYEAFHNEGEEFKAEEELTASLFLVHFKLNKVKKKTQFADYFKSAPLAANLYKIRGKVIAKVQLADKNWIVVIDAGKGFTFNITASNAFAEGLKENNYVYLEGRLDLNRSDKK